MADYYMLLTDIGAARLANAQITGTPVQLAELALGDGGGVAYMPTKDQTALANEVWRAALNDVRVDAVNAAWVVCEGVVPAADGPFYVRELGVFDAAGYLIAIGRYPETYKPNIDSGAGKDMLVRAILEVSSTESVEITVDPTIVLATRDHVAEQIAAHEAKTDPHQQYALNDDLDGHANSRNHPAATETAQGMVELATAAEVEAGVDTTRVCTPAALAALVSGGASGYAKLPGGILVQWLTVSMDTATQLFTWPLAFSFINYVAVATDDAATTTVFTVGLHRTSTSQFTLFSRRASDGAEVAAQSVFVIGIGRF